MNDIERAQKIKGIKSQLSRLRVVCESAKRELNESQLYYNGAVEKINTLENELDVLKVNGKLVVSEHAMIQFLRKSELLTV